MNKIKITGKVNYTGIKDPNTGVITTEKINAFIYKDNSLDASFHFDSKKHPLGSSEDIIKTYNNELLRLTNDYEKN